MQRKAFSAAGAISVGPYSHAVECGEIVYLSGQTPLDSATGKLVEGDIIHQTEQCFKNLFNVLNAVYSNQFKAPYPARTTIGVASLPLGARVEIEMIAIKK